MAPKRRKQVIGDAKSFRGEFSFVNKDASNIDSKDHNAAVSWHVMNRYERWKKKEEVKKLRASATLATNQSSSTSSTTALDGDQGAEIYPPSPWQMINIEQSMLDSFEPASGYGWTQQSSSLEDHQDLTFAEAEEAMGASGSLQSLEQPQQSSQYPPLVAQILSYAYGHVIPTTFPNEYGKAKWTYEISHTWSDIAAIQEDSCYASALLCFYATLMAAATNDRDVTSQACFFQVQAMTELRQRLETQPNSHDPSTLKAILKLFSAETALDNTSAARIHMKSLRGFVSAAGGIFTLDPWFREDLLATDCYFALKYETRPLFPASEWTPGSMNQPWKTRLAQARVREDHATGIDASIEHINLRGILGDLRELFQAEQYVNTHEVSADDQFLRWRQLRKLDCLSRLAEHQLSVKIYPHRYEKSKLQLAVCAAAALMTAMVLGSPEPVRSGLKLVSDLRLKLAAARAEISEGHNPAERQPSAIFENVLLWIVCVGALGEQTHPIPSESVWFQTELYMMLMDLGLLEFEDRRRILRRFLYSSWLEDEIQNGQAHRVVEPRKGVYGPSGMSWRLPMELTTEAGNPEDSSVTFDKGKQSNW